MLWGCRASGPRVLILGSAVNLPFAFWLPFLATFVDQKISTAECLAFDNNLLFVPS